MKREIEFSIQNNWKSDLIMMRLRERGLHIKMLITLSCLVWRLAITAWRRVGKNVRCSERSLWSPLCFPLSSDKSDRSSSYSFVWFERSKVTSVCSDSSLLTSSILGSQFHEIRILTPVQIKICRVRPKIYEIHHTAFEELYNCMKSFCHGLNCGQEPQYTASLVL